MIKLHINGKQNVLHVMAVFVYLSKWLNVIILVFVFLIMEHDINFCCNLYILFVNNNGLFKAMYII